MALQKKELIKTGETYTDKDGNTKTSWRTVGELLTLDSNKGGTFKMLKLHMFPNVKFNVFTEEPKSDKADHPNDLPF